MTGAMHRLPRLSLAVLLAWGFAATASALTLQQAYEAALTADPRFQGERYERDAGLQAVPLARAALLPSLNLSASQMRYNGHRKFPSQTGAELRQELHYTAPQQALNLRLGLYNPENLRRYTLARKQATHSELVFVTREVELVDRVATAYLQVLLLGEALRLAQAETEAFRAQALSAERRLARGEGTRIELAETTARLGLAQAQLSEAQDALVLARTELQNMVGLDPGELQSIAKDSAPAPLAPATLQEWLDAATANSPMLAARRMAVEVAEADLARARAGHLPRLDLVAGVTRSRSESVSTLEQDLHQRFVGVQLNVPLYAGGYVNSATEQALAMVRRAQADLDQERAGIDLAVRRAFLTCQSAVARVQAYARAVDASQAALDGTRRGLAAGLRTNVEVLDAQRQVFQARRDLAKTRHEELLARLRLHTHSGSAVAQVIAELSALLAAPP